MLTKVQELSGCCGTPAEHRVRSVLRASVSSKQSVEVLPPPPLPNPSFAFVLLQPAHTKQVMCGITCRRIQQPEANSTGRPEDFWLSRGRTWGFRASSIVSRFGTQSCMVRITSRNFRLRTKHATNTNTAGLRSQIYLSKTNINRPKHANPTHSNPKTHRDPKRQQLHLACKIPPNQIMLQRNREDASFKKHIPRP